MNFKKVLKVFGVATVTAVATATAFALGVYEGLSYAKAAKELEEEMEAYEKSVMTGCDSKEDTNPRPA